VGQRAADFSEAVKRIQRTEKDHHRGERSAGGSQETSPARNFLLNRPEPYSFAFSSESWIDNQF
jgi:hypothetical protein